MRLWKFFFVCVKMAAKIFAEDVNILAKHKKKNQSSTVSGKIKISLCYIVKDCAQDLQRSLESAANHVDEIIVVDTGSTDSTVEVAQNFGAKILHEPWQDDFSTPRNKALEAATGNWIVFLDSDEFFVNDTAKNLRTAIKNAKRNKFIGLFIKWINVDKDNDFKLIEESSALRIFENVPNLHYVGKIHENVYVGDEILTNIALITGDMLTLWHTGYSKSIIKSKLERNLKPLLEELSTSDKPERTYSYLADCYYGLEDFANAEKFARLHVETNKRTLSTRALRILLNILKRDSARADEYAKYLKLAVADYPAVPEFSAMLAEVFAKQGKYREAVDEMQRALDKAANYADQYEGSTFDETEQNRAQDLIDEWEVKIPYTPEEKRP